MILKQPYCTNIAIGGPTKEIYPLWLSIYNFGGIDSDPIAMSEDFQYFIISEEKYIYTRSVIHSFNWPYKWKGTKGGCWKFAQIKSKKELASFKGERFVPYSSHSIDYYDFGNLPKNLDALNDELNYNFSGIDKDISVEILKEKI